MLKNVTIRLNLKFKGVFMKNIIITSVAAVAVLAFAGCAPKTSCKKACPTPVAVKAPAPVAVKAAPAPVAPPVVQAVEPVVVPVIDAKEAAVQ